MTYKERVDNAAKELYPNEPLGELTADQWFIAHKAVLLQADAIRESLPIIFKHPEIAKYVEQYLKQNGYIPEKEEDNAK